MFFFVWIAMFLFSSYACPFSYNNITAKELSAVDPVCLALALFFFFFF